MKENPYESPMRRMDEKATWMPWMTRLVFVFAGLGALFFCLLGLVMGNIDSDVPYLLESLLGAIYIALSGATLGGLFGLIVPALVILIRRI